MKRLAVALILAAVLCPPAAAQCADGGCNPSLPPSRESTLPVSRKTSATTTYICVGLVSAFAAAVVTRLLRDHNSIIAPRRRRPWDY